jgi:hypothetical protein
LRCRRRARLGAPPVRAAGAWSTTRFFAQHLRLALGWLDADAAPEEARLAGRQQRLAERPADGELVVRLLAEPGVDPGAAASVYTPLARAAELGHLGAARLLLDGGADPSHVAGDGATALMAAAGCGQYLEVLRLLLARGAAVDAVSPAYGTTAFHITRIAQGWPKLPDLAQHLDWKSRLEP